MFLFLFSSPSYTGDEIVIPSEDGSELYSFDKSGRHLATMNTLTNALVYQFTYDSNNQFSHAGPGRRRKRDDHRAYLGRGAPGHRFPRRPAHDAGPRPKRLEVARTGWTPTPVAFRP